ncbi:MAG: hypothetical protein J7J31_11135 [Helicobacteraceae bacterium]|nr:hypothetical protein [Helicobacteraceae bacterium]
MIIFKIILGSIAALFISACGSEEVSGVGWHFNGRDCLACHNSDLGEEKHLVIAGTLYKNKDVTDTDDLTNVCNADLVFHLTDLSGNIVYSSASYTDRDSKGYRGAGNIFLLDRLFDQNLNGTYHVRIAERTTNRVLAVGLNHPFSGVEYTPKNSQDDSNRLSCNACHGKAGTQDPLYVQFSANLDVCQ